MKKTILNEKGNVFTFLLGGIAIVGLISLGGYQLISGSLSSASDATQTNMVKNQLLLMAQVATRDAVNQSGGGDCDNDGIVEPRPFKAMAGGPTNGGGLHLLMGAAALDPWGNEYGYCVWDMGAVSGAASCGGGAGYLDGADNPMQGQPQSLTSLAIISAGADHVFQTTCLDYVDTTTDVMTVAGDDIVHRYTYAQADEAASNIWTLKIGDASVATVNKDLEIGSNITFNTAGGIVLAQQINTQGKIIATKGVDIGNQSDVGGCSASLYGLLSYDAGKLDVCTDSGWTATDSGGASLTWPIRAPSTDYSTPQFTFSNNTTAGLYYDDSGNRVGLVNSTSGKTAKLATGTSSITASYSGIEIKGEYISFESSSTSTTFNRSTGPNFRMVIDGALQIGETTGTCNSGSEGTIRYVPADQNYEFCNGSAWIDLNTTEGAGGGATTDATIFVGRKQACGTKEDGTLWCWGTEQSGELGDGGSASATQQSPVQVASTIPWKMTLGGGDFQYAKGCGIKQNGTLWCWGNDTNGGLGDGGIAYDKTVPVQVADGGPWKYVDAQGNRFGCGIKDDDTLWCWGRAYYGQTGSGTNPSTGHMSPVEVAGGGTWSDVSTGDAHACGIKTNGTLWCWGETAYGRVGNNDTATDALSPVQVTGGGTWIGVGAGWYHSCAIKSDNSLWCWGRNNWGQLGTGSTGSDVLTPVSVGGSDWSSVIDGGAYHTCALKNDGSAWCWGSDFSGNLGAGNNNDYFSPNPVAGGHTWKSIIAGYWNTCAIRNDNAAYCWGYDDGGALGNGAGGNSNSPAPVSYP